MTPPADVAADMIDSSRIAAPAVVQADSAADMLDRGIVAMPAIASTDSGVS